MKPEGMKGIFSQKSAIFQLAVLISLVCMGMTVSFILGTLAHLLYNGVPQPGSMMDMPFYFIQIVQFLSTICTILLPALGTAYLCSSIPTALLGLNGTKHLKPLIAATFMVILIQPFISIVNHFNMQMQFPEPLSGLEEIFRTMEENARKMTERILSEKGLPAIITNLIIVAALAAVAEELMFRGALLSIVRKMAKNPHVAIWSVAIIFSTVHFQFYGFLPRMILGALLGYLLYWTNDIKIPIFAHFLNNATAVVISMNESLRNNAFSSNEIKPENLPIMGIFAVVGLILCGLSKKIIDGKSH